MAALPRTVSKVGKRIVVACDGTWVSSDNGFTKDSWFPWGSKGHLTTPSNVTRICRALKPRSTDGNNIPQIIYYQGGIGSQGNFYSSIFGGYLGSGIDENIREAYGFICNNYEDGDDIFLIGFSRGAFTARSIGGLIASIGLLTKDGLRAFYPIYRDWENQANPQYKSEYDSSVWPLENRPKFTDPAYMQGLLKARLTMPNIPIKAIGVFDTVGSLGVPNIKLWGLPLHTTTRREYSFINTEVAPNVENAYQALALDERRDPFSPTVWEAPKPGTNTKLKELRQCWFPGVHSAVGGGYQDTSISDITLAWMISRLSKDNMLSFDPEYVLDIQKANLAFYEKVHVTPPREYAMGLIKRSDLGALNYLMGTSSRKPGQNHATNLNSGSFTSRLLRGTEETIHPSVRYRKDNGGAGLASKEGDYRGDGSYNPEALSGWKFAAAGQELNIKGTQDWDLTTRDNGGRWYLEKNGEDAVVLEEEHIEKDTAEWALLNAWGDDVSGQVLKGN